MAYGAAKINHADKDHQCLWPDHAPFQYRAYLGDAFIQRRFAISPVNHAVLYDQMAADERLENKGVKRMFKHKDACSKAFGGLFF